MTEVLRKAFQRERKGIVGRNELVRELVRTKLVRKLVRIKLVRELVRRQRNCCWRVWSQRNGITPTTATTSRCTCCVL